MKEGRYTCDVSTRRAARVQRKSRFPVRAVGAERCKVSPRTGSRRPSSDLFSLRHRSRENCQLTTDSLSSVGAQMTVCL